MDVKRGPQPARACKEPHMNKPPTVLELLKLAAAATFRPMTSSDMIFSGAPDGSRIADQHPDVLVIHAPAYADVPETFEFHGTDAEGDCWSVALHVFES
jgi:hypothetical protein